MSYILYIFISFLSLSFCARSKEEWKTRSIYQLLTDRFARADEETPECNLNNYNGGSFKGIISKLDYIAEMGFNAIWISPVSKNDEGKYHGYHTVNYNEINEHFGTSEDLKSLVEECHKRDIWVMVDIVLNHVAPVGTDYSRIVPFNEEKYYHDYCDITDWNNQIMVENCRLYGLPDLKQENDFVRKYLINYAKNLIEVYNIDGFRLADSNNIPKWFWDEFKKEILVFSMGNAINTDSKYIAGYTKRLDSMTNYPFYNKLTQAFCSSNFKLIEDYLINDRQLYNDPSVMGNFLENHDKPRFLSVCKDRIKFINAAVLTIMTEGIPIFYYGGENYFDGDNDPNNRECMFGKYKQTTKIFKYLKAANKIRQNLKLYNEKVIQKYLDESFYAFTRGKVLIAITKGDKFSIKLTNDEYEIGQKLCNAFDESDCITVESKGIQLTIDKLPKIYYPI